MSKKKWKKERKRLLRVFNLLGFSLSIDVIDYNWTLKCLEYMEINKVTKADVSSYKTILEGKERPIGGR